MTKRQATEADLLMWEQLRDMIGTYTIKDMQKEFVFSPLRKWRSDFMIIAGHGAVARLLIEIEGGVWTNGAHVRGKHFISDMEKYNHAALLGWRVLRFTPQQVLKGEAIAFIKRVLER